MVKNGREVEDLKVVVGESEPTENGKKSIQAIILTTLKIRPG